MRTHQPRSTLAGGIAEPRKSVGRAALRPWAGRRAALSAALAWLIAPVFVAAQDTKPEENPRARALAGARTALVQVELFLRIPGDDDPDALGGVGETVAALLQDRQQEQAAREQKAVQLMGVVLSEREVLVPDTGIDPRRVERWEVVESSGRRTEARRTAMLLDAPTLVLEPSDDAFRWPVPEFADAPVEAATQLILVTPQWLQSDWVLAVSGARTVSRWSSAAQEPEEPASFWHFAAPAASTAAADALFGGTPRPAAHGLLFTPGGQLIGASVADRAYPDRPAPPWRAADLRGAARLRSDQWEELQQHTREALRPVLYPVRIEYRRPKGGAQGFPDSELLGWGISPRMLLVAEAIHRSIAARIARITVQVGGSEIEAEFLGQLRDFDAFAIALPEGAEPLPAHSDLDERGAARPYRPHVAVTLHRKYGEHDLRVDYARMLGSAPGYGNRRQPQLVPAPSLGSLVLDLEGKPIGLFARRRRLMEELEPYERARSVAARFGQQMASSSAELFTLDAWAGVLASPADHFDPHVVRRDEREQDRRVWLGVEFNPLTRDLAESLGCRRESRDGGVGLMISQVYAGSPAESVGLRTGDVLLSIEIAGRRAIELSPPRGFGAGGTPDFAQLARGEGRAGPGAPHAPWPSRNNYLTNLLAIIGADTPIELRVWRDGRLETMHAVVAQAPPDQDSAAQFRDERLGITVKEMTYEVRTALNLKPGDAGVVVAKIESGSPAALAKIQPFEIVHSADGAPIDSPAKLEEIIDQARANKTEKISLVVADRIGRSRFADLRIGR